MTDLFGDEPERRFFRVRMASGEYHVGSEPPGERSWWPKYHPEVLEWMGANGYTCTEELPVEVDHMSGTCGRCGCEGTEIHHTAPREIFEDADEWPTMELCVEHHREWHERMNAWRYGLPLGWEGIDVVC